MNRTYAFAWAASGRGRCARRSQSPAAPLPRCSWRTSRQFWRDPLYIPSRPTLRRRRLVIVCCDGGIQEAHGLFHDRAKNNLNTTVKWICRGGWLIELVRKHSDRVLIFLKEYVAIRADMDDGSDCRLHGEYSEPVQELRVTERTCQNCRSIDAVQKCDHAAKVWRIYAVAEAPTSQEDSTSSTFKAITMSVMEPDDGAYDPQSVKDALERFVLREEVISGPNVYGTSHPSRPASPH